MHMIKFAYIDGYNIFARADLRTAEELLREYNDFYVYNQSQYSHIFSKVEIDEDDHDDEKTIEVKKLRAEANAKAASDHFATLFGSKDFAHSSLIGLRISWDDLQKIMLEEFRSKTPATSSAMNHIAPTLRKLASSLLFAEYFYDKINRMYKSIDVKPTEIEKVKAHNERVDSALRHLREWIDELLERLNKGREGDLPEYYAYKNKLYKYKTVEMILEFVEKELTLKP